MGETTGPAPQWPARVGVALAAGSAACVVAGVGLHLTGAAGPRPPTWSDAVLALVFPVAGVLVLRRDPRNPCGWLLSSFALVGVSVLAHRAALDERTDAVRAAATWLAAWTYWPYFLQPTLLPVLFPYGRAPSPRWRLFVRAVVAVVVVGVLASMLKPDDDVEGMGLANPLGIGPVFLLPAWVVAQAGSVAVLGLIASPIALVGLARRQRAAAGQERTQLQWLLLGFTTCLVLGIASALLPELAGDVLFGLGFAAIPVCVAVAVLRHGMLDVEHVVNRTVVLAVLTGVGVLAYLGLATAVSRYAGTDGAGPLLAAAVVAAAAAARTRVQGLVDRRLFGARRDPYAVVQQVGTSTAGIAAPEDALAALVASTRQALRLPFVQVLDEAGEEAAAAGAPVAGTHVLPIVERGRQLGVLVVGRRSQRERLGSVEVSALQEVARRAGSLLHARSLTAELLQSWERTVLAREDERRRVRRDLHDGVGPALAGVALQLDSLAARLHGDPALAERAERLRDRLQTTVGEVRRIVDGLRPAAVDELGLVGALEAFATDDVDAVHVRVDVDVPGELPAAVEVAAYRIVSEALANVLRHACADRAEVVARVHEEALHVSVRDNGRGFGTEATAGVGLQSLHDRAAEVGGVLTITSASSGTDVVAALPLQRS